MAHLRTISDRPTPEPSTLVFFIPGNPGLISYYTLFLSQLSSLLSHSLSPSASSSSQCYRITGTSLANFPSCSTRKPVLNRPLGLEEQIVYVERALLSDVRSYRTEKSKQRRREKVKVVLIGHSVGTYILLEILRRYHTRLSTNDAFEIIGGVLLFPTVTYLAESPSGLRFSKILKIPYLALVTSILVKLLVFLVPEFILCSLVKSVTGFPAEAARTTTSFIKSPMGVRQALHLAEDEINVITVDKWQEEIWGAADARLPERKPPVPRSKLVFFWGQNDHWVADKTRDELVAHRGYLWSKGTASSTEEEWKPKMVLDEDGIPHGFCIKHNDIVAERVKEWVNEIVEADRSNTAIAG